MYVPPQPSRSRAHAQANSSPSHRMRKIFEHSRDHHPPSLLTYRSSPQLHEHLQLPHRRAQRRRAAHGRVRPDDLAPDGHVLPHAAHGRQRHQAALRLRRRAAQAQVGRAREAVPAQAGGARGARGGQGDGHGRGRGEVRAPHRARHARAQRRVPAAADAHGRAVHRGPHRGGGAVRRAGEGGEGVCGCERGYGYALLRVAYLAEASYV